MSGAPHIELNKPDLPDLDPSAPSNAADVYANGHTAAAREDAKDSLLSSAHVAMDSVTNHPVAQNIKDTVANGPMAQNVKSETAKTKNEFANLANARTTPGQPAATGQPLTHYHSMFYRLLSWKNPRATAISFAAAVAFIFAARYLNILRYVFKALWVTLGCTAAAEMAGKAAFGHGFTSQFRPRKYFVIPKASLERLLDDVEQLINFFVIEFQRIVFAENVAATVAAFFAAFVSYFLIQVVPIWGLTLLSTMVVYLAPLVYIKNKAVIDRHVEQATVMVNQQATQMRQLAAEHTGNAAKTFQTYAGEYTTKAQDAINQYRGRSTSPEATVHKDDFPAAPRAEPVRDAPAAAGTTESAVPAS